MKPYQSFIFPWECNPQKSEPLFWMHLQQFSPNHTIDKGEQPFASTTVVYLPENCCKSDHLW
ncbi:MAG: hypothetical protein PUP92_23940 [Rhizonema sp. PD38]|nr:hypothetical protein [Rhizonema sp. PD38]